jgi:hypothetical protein
MITANVNWLAVTVGAVIAYGLGYLWYSPKLFGKKPGVGSSRRRKISPSRRWSCRRPARFLWPVVGVTAADNALPAVILVVATIVALMLAGSLFTQKSRYAMFTEAGFVVAMAAIMIAVQGLL